MKKIAFGAAVVAGLAIAWIAGAHVIAATAFDRAWASDEFVRRLPHNAENESATRISATAERLGELDSIRPALRDVLRGKAPSDGVVRFLESRANAIRTLRAAIISNPPPVWAADPEEILDPVEPPLALHLRLYTVLGADAALQRSRANERAAESDLRAVSILARSLEQRPEIGSLIVALIGHRIAASPPSDVRGPLLRAIEYDAWITRARAERYPAGEPNGSQLADAIRGAAAPFLRPIRVAQADLEIGRMQKMATAVAATPPSSPLPVPELRAWAPLFARINRSVRR